MGITDKTLIAIKERIFPPYCSSLDMAEVVIKRFLKRQSFSVSELSSLSEEDGLALAVHLKEVFPENMRKKFIELIQQHNKKGENR